MDTNFVIASIVFQPTSLCNLNCGYCYLGQRDQNLKMFPEVCVKVAESIEQFNSKIHLIWHGGEPLSCGLSHFENLIRPFDELKRKNRITHSIQTNATLINQQWCKFFRAHEIEVGVSIDGSRRLNENRVDWNGKAAYDNAIRGIQHLKNAGIDFSVICVVGKENLDKAKELYAFFCELGCSIIGVNLEEREGINDQREICDDSAIVIRFWQELFEAWRIDPRIRIREFDSILSWMQSIYTNRRESSDYDMIPTVMYNGNVVLLSPELAGTKSLNYNDFVVGNVLEESLLSIVERHRESKYFKDFVTGVGKCEKQCKYFSFCRGGRASNKFFELNTIDATETVFCRNSQQRLVDGVLSKL